MPHFRNNLTSGIRQSFYLPLALRQIIKLKGVSLFRFRDIHVCRRNFSDFHATEVYWWKSRCGRTLGVLKIKCMLHGRDETLLSIFRTLFSLLFVRTWSVYIWENCSKKWASSHWRILKNDIPNRKTFLLKRIGVLTMKPLNETTFEIFLRKIFFLRMTWTYSGEILQAARSQKRSWRCACWMISGKAECLRSFRRKPGADLRFDYHHDKNTWMWSEVVFFWFQD